MYITLSRSGLATKTEFYHGTSTKFLRTILKKGLQSNPQQRVWQEDQGSDARQTSRKSLNGVYATTNLMTAISSAGNAYRKFGGRPLIVIIKGQARSGFHDEDSVRGAIQRAFSAVTSDSVYSRVGEIYAIIYAKDNNIQGYHNINQWYNEILNKFKEITMELSENEMPKRAIHLFDTILEEIFKCLIRRVVFYGNEEYRESGKGWHAPGNYFKQFFHMGGVIYEKDEYGKYHDPYEFYENKELPDYFVPKDKAILVKEEDFWGDPKKEDAKYLRILDKITRMFRSTLPKVLGGYNGTIRFPEDVKFKGANKIVAILEELDRDNSDKKIGEPFEAKIKVHYGKATKEFERRFKERVIGDNGIIIYE